MQSKWYSTESSRLTLVPSNRAMELEDLNIIEPEKFEERISQANIKEVIKEASHKNDSLKFCRKLVRNQLKLLENRESFVWEVLMASYNILAHFKELLQINDKGQLKQNYFAIVKEFWTDQKDYLSYSKNKKISILSNESWKRQFDEKSFKEYISQQFNFNEVISESLECNSSYAREAFLLLSQTLLFRALQVINLVIVFCFSSITSEIESGFPMQENFTILMLEPSLYAYYNHTRGKFFTECCGKCKVCRGKMKNQSVTADLRTMRETFVFLERLFAGMDLANSKNTNIWVTLMIELHLALKTPAKMYE